MEKIATLLKMKLFINGNEKYMPPQLCLEAATFPMQAMLPVNFLFITLIVNRTFMNTKEKLPANPDQNIF